LKTLTVGRAQSRTAQAWGQRAKHVVFNRPKRRAIIKLLQMIRIYNKDQLSLTNPRDALHHGERAANK